MHRTITLALLLALAFCIPAFAEQGAVEVGSYKGDTAAPAETTTAGTAAAAPGEAAYVLDLSVYEMPKLDLEGRLPITLAEALEAATKESYGARLALSTFERSQFDLNLALAPFDPMFQAQAGTTSSDREGTVLDTSTKSHFYSLDLSEQFPTGDTFSVHHELTRTDVNQFGTGAAVIDNDYGNSLGFTLTHPLGKGLGRAANYYQVESALNRRPYQQLVYDDAIRNLRYQAYVLYYNLVAQKRELEVRQLNLELAMKLLERNYERHKVGLAIRADVLQAENNVLTQKSRLIDGQRSYLDQLDQLSLLLGVSQKLDIVSDVDLSPIATSLDVNGDWERVRNASTSLRLTEVQLRDAELNLGFLRNQLKPDLGLSLGYNRQGNAGTAGSALRDYGNESYNLSLNYKLPIGKRSYKARMAQGEQDLESAKVQSAQTSQQLRETWEALFRELDSKSSQIGLAASSVTVAQENYDIQVERNKVGWATTLDVIQAQEALLEAQLAHLFAQVDYQTTYLKMMIMVGDI
jgi:outer membrane protein TolC